MTLVLGCFFSVSSLAASGGEGLLSEPALNPGDISTSDVLRKNEWSYNQPLIPAPGWMRWGLTENLTVQLDFTAWIFGVPSANFRYSFSRAESGRSNLALEMMYVYFVPDHPELQDFNKDDKNLFIQRKGHTGYAKISGSHEYQSQLILYGSLGASYSQSYEVRNENRSRSYGKEFEKLWDPTATLAVEYRATPNLAYHFNASYGETFFLMENRPRKHQIVYGVRLAPYLTDKKSFYRNIRFELNALYFSFPDAREEYVLPLPIYPYAYWQWQF